MIANAQPLGSKNVSSIAYTVDGTQVTNESIRIVIDNYFNWHYKSLKAENNKYKDALDSMVINKNLINFKKTKLKWMSEWSSNTNTEVKDYKIYTDINEIIVKEDTIYITATYGEDLVENGSEDVVQERRNQKHQIVLKNLDNNLVIANDYYNDELADEFFMVSDEEFKAESNINKKLDIKTNEFNTNLDKVTELATQYKNQLQEVSYSSNSNPMAKKYSNYNGHAAKVYAVDHAKSYNSNYSNYNSRGGDCTNFASQCIKYGGIPTDGTWYKDSNAWIRVRELRNWLINKGYARELTWQENSSEGDLVQLKNSNGEWYHSLIITYKDRSGVLYISCHSGNEMNVNIDKYPNAKRYLILTS